MKKRFLIPFLAFVILCAALLPVCAQADGSCGADGSRVSWTLEDDGTLRIRGEGEMRDFNGMGGPWNEPLVKKIVIEPGVTRIGANAFFLCSAESVEIPDSVTSIGYAAFCNCKELTTVVFPDSLSFIDSSAFAYCTSLTSVELGSGVRYIDEYAFFGCTNLTVYAPLSLHDSFYPPKDLNIIWTADEQPSNGSEAIALVIGVAFAAAVVWMLVSGRRENGKVEAALPEE